MSFQRSTPFLCKQCNFCKDAERVDGGAIGVESLEYRAWFCSPVCYQLKRLFQGDSGLNRENKQQLIKTYNNCFIKTIGNKDFHVADINEKRVNRMVRSGQIKIIKDLYSNYQIDEDDENS